MAETDVDALWRMAATLGRDARRRYPASSRLPSLFYLTDPARTPDPARVMRRLPAGAAVIYRAFGAADAAETGAKLRALATARRLVFLVGADPDLARRLRADGLHLPERLLSRAPRLRRAHPRWLLTGAAHGPQAIARAARLGLDAALVSAVFASRSASAGAPLGALRFAALARRARLPIVALGGIDARNARRLARSGAAGLAAVEGLAGPG